MVLARQRGIECRCQNKEPPSPQEGQTRRCQERSCCGSLLSLSERVPDERPNDIGARDELARVGQLVDLLEQLEREPYRHPRRLWFSRAHRIIHPVGMTRILPRAPTRGTRNAASVRRE